MRLQETHYAETQKAVINQIIQTKGGDNLPNDSFNKYKKIPNYGVEIDENYEAPTANQNSGNRFQKNNNDKYSKAGKRCYRCRRQGHFAKECRIPYDIIEQEKRRYEEQKKARSENNR